MRTLLLLIALTALAACGRLDVADYRDAKPALELERYFDGRLKAHGQFQDRFGRVKRRFVVDIEGRWDGSTLTLDEAFVYDDGERERRVWTLQKTADGGWTGRADGVVGVATGRGAGNAFNWRYDFDLATDDGTYRLHFDDWLFLQDEHVLLNRARVSKFGFTVGEVLIAFDKEATAAP
jgi:hypothetical protein